MHSKGLGRGVSWVQETPFIFHSRKFHSVARVSDETLGQFTFINKYIIMTYQFNFNLPLLTNQISPFAGWALFRNYMCIRNEATLFGCSFVKTKQRLVLFLYNTIL